MSYSNSSPANGASAPQVNTPADRVETVGGAAVRAVAEAVDRLRYGVVQLTIHDGRVVQLDVTERQRFT